MTTNKKLFTLTGPSCSGKTTLVRALLKTGHFEEVVSFTSRQPRGGEKHGVDYYFLDPKMCEKLVAAGETAENIKFKDNYYGITKAEIELRFITGKTPIAIVEPRGLAQLNDSFDVYSIYVDARLETLYTRFLSRFKQTENPNIEYEARRIAAIYLEQAEWKNLTISALGNKLPQYVISEYTPGNEAAIVMKLMADSIFYNKT